MSRTGRGDYIQSSIQSNKLRKRPSHAPIQRICWPANDSIKERDLGRVSRFIDRSSECLHLDGQGANSSRNRSQPHLLELDGVRLHLRETPVVIHRLSPLVDCNIEYASTI